MLIGGGITGGHTKRIFNGGFTLLEIMVVIAIIGIMITIIMSTSVGQLEKSRLRKTQADLSSMKAALDIYAMEEGSGKYPDSESSLEAAMETQGIDWYTCRDGWAKPYKYYVNNDYSRYYLLSEGNGGSDYAEDKVYVSEKQTPVKGEPVSVDEYETVFDSKKAE